MRRDRDRGVLGEIQRASQVFAALETAELPSRLQDASRHLIPRQFAWARSAGDQAAMPQVIFRDDKSVLYQFKPQMASAQRFEKIGEGPGYIWGSGSGFVEYTVPEREDRRRVSEIIVRAHVQPVRPVDATESFVKTRVTLFVEGWNAGSRLIPFEPARTAVDSGVAADGPLAASACDAWSAAEDPFRRDARIRLALRRQHIELARRLRLQGRQTHRTRATALGFTSSPDCHYLFCLYSLENSENIWNEWQCVRQTSARSVEHNDRQVEPCQILLED